MQNKRTWIPGMNATKLPKQSFLYTPRGKIDIDHPRKRWEVETGAGRFHMP
jgi:hypothetical protein